MKKTHIKINNIQSGGHLPPCSLCSLAKWVVYILLLSEKR